MKRTFLAVLLILAAMAALSACGGSALPATPTAAPSPTAQPVAVASHVVISEVMTGVQGNNNHDFVELYNPTHKIINLKGWSLWHKLSPESEAVRIFLWKGSALVPPGGHYLLVHKGEDFGLPPDAEFSAPLVPARGALQLRDAKGNAVDALAWGNGPADFGEGKPAPKLSNGKSLERLPGGAKGNGQDTDNNAADFHITTPNPQDTGSVPAEGYGIAVQLEWQAPAQAKPGSEIKTTLIVRNTDKDALTNLTVHFRWPAALKPKFSAEVPQKNGEVVWQIPNLNTGAEKRLALAFQAPWTYTTLYANGYYAEAGGRYAFGKPVVLKIAGGVIPIGVARKLPAGTEVVVEGVATMYPGGFYAGGGNVKFYVQDKTGGVQVQVFGGEDKVAFQIGAKVRVRGVMAAYRGAIQIQPKVVPDDITVIAPPSGEPKPLRVSLAEAATNHSLEGMLVEVEGTITALQEHSYSYTITLADESGHTLELYVDKNTHANPMAILEVGQKMRAIGILDERDGAIQLYPRRQSDMVRIFPPVLMVKVSAPLHVRPGETFPVTLTVENHTPNALTHVRASLPIPQRTRVAEVKDGGKIQNGAIVWEKGSLEGNGGVWKVQATFQATGSGEIALKGYQATADQWQEPATGPARFVFLGDIVPIWAIQGSGLRSPYVGETVTTGGIVTGVYPELNGFWIQDQKPDGDPQTSEGIFVSVPERVSVDVAKGDLVRVTGKVEEAWQQTVIELGAADDLVVQGHNLPLPKPVEWNPPTDPQKALEYDESLEGMLVETPAEVVAVGPTTKYGETPIVALSHYNGQHIHRGDPDGFLMMVDDGTEKVYRSAEGMPYRAATGDHLKAVVGPLAYTYGAYKVEPLQMPVVAAIPHPLNRLPQAPDDVLTVMTWNTENFFDPFMPNPRDPPLPTPEQYHVSVQKVANTIAYAGFPLIVGVEEVENIKVLNDVAATDVLKPYHYKAELIEGHDSRGIDVGFLIRTDRVEILDVKQYDAPEGLTPRPPLVAHLRIKGGSQPLEVYAIVNHFTSMAGGEKVTEPRRVAQAKWNLTVISQIKQSDPQAKFILMGDLNSFYDSPPLQVLRDGGLVHVMDGMTPEQRYTFIYKGETQTLDHILTSLSLHDLLEKVVVFHADCDFPPPEPDDTSPRRKSDHDPVIAWFKLP